MDIDIDCLFVVEVCGGVVIVIVECDIGYVVEVDDCIVVLFDD